MAVLSDDDFASLEVVSNPHLPAIKSGTLHPFIIFKVLRRPNNPVVSGTNRLT